MTGPDVKWHVIGTTQTWCVQIITGGIREIQVLKGVIYIQASYFAHSLHGIKSLKSSVAAVCHLRHPTAVAIEVVFTDIRLAGLLLLAQEGGELRSGGCSTPRGVAHVRVEVDSLIVAVTHTLRISSLKITVTGCHNVCLHLCCTTGSVEMSMSI